MGFTTFCFCLLAFLFSSHVSADSLPKGPFIYVADFDLEVENIHERDRILPRSLGHSGFLGKLRSSGNSQNDSEATGREIVNLMADSIVSDLRNLCYGSRRLAPGEPLPENGMLVRGLFANVDEGNRLRRAVIGFGAGHTDLQVIVSVSTLDKGTAEPFYNVNIGAQRGKMPGAVITLNPYVAAAKFALAGRDMKKGITKTASKIASAVAKQIQSATTRTEGANATPLPESDLDK